MMSRMWWCGVACLALAVAGCGKVADKAASVAVEKAIEAQAGKDVQASVDTKAGTLKIASKDGSEQVSVVTADGKATVSSQDGTVSTVVGEEAKVPESFPKDIPVYAGIKVIAASEDAKDKTFMIQAETQDALDAVSGFYAKELAGKGWAEAQTMNQGGETPMRMLSYTKDGRDLMLVLQSSNGKTSLTIHTNGGQ